MTTIGLWLNFIGSLLLGVSTQFGSAAAWGGKMVWTANYWRLINALGWLFLAIGFLMQI